MFNNCGICESVPDFLKNDLTLSVNEVTVSKELMKTLIEF